MDRRIPIPFLFVQVSDGHPLEEGLGPSEGPILSSKLYPGLRRSSIRRRIRTVLKFGQKASVHCVSDGHPLEEGLGLFHDVIFNGLSGRSPTVIH